MPDPKIVAAMDKYRNALLKADAAAATRLVNAYGRIFAKLQNDIRALEADIADLGDNPTRGQIVRLERYKALLEQTASEMDRYATILGNEVDANRALAIQNALGNNRALVQAALPNLPPAAQAQILAGFNRLNPAAIESILGALTDSPLSRLLENFGGRAAQDISNAILEGVALGYNPRKVAARIADVLGGNLTRSLTIARTETLRAYRTAALANYRSNSAVVKGWKWNSTKDNVCCLACLALDGQTFSLDKNFMPAHPNCRCAPEPVTVSYKDLGLDVPDLEPRTTATDWFNGLPETEQRQFFTAAAWRAYQDGAVGLTDFIGLQKSKDWGDAYVERSLKDILGNDANKYYATRAA